MSQLEAGFEDLDAPGSPIAPETDTLPATPTVDESPPQPPASNTQVIPTATPLSRDQSFPRRDPTPHHKLKNVRVIDDMPYSYEFTNPLTGAKTVVTITDVWCIHIIAGHLRAGKHLDFYRKNYSDLYYLIAKCLNQEPFLIARECQLPMITEDGLVLKLGTHNPSAVMLGLVAFNPAKGSAAKQEVMSRPIPRLKRPAVPSTPAMSLPDEADDPYADIYQIEPSLLFQSVVSLARTSNQELQRLRASKDRSREKHAERAARRDHPLHAARGPTRRRRGGPSADQNDEPLLADDSTMNVD
ncbi:hypothetical protein EYR40_001953 [Pleurotus pulmonarius]|nr:hypothetical protein EYR40_001953 [Pleurotus pulmonarius]